MADELYFEDFQLGQKFESKGSVKITAREITEFAEKYDPQPFHLDEAAGKSTFFKGQAASGWLTAAIVMRTRSRHQLDPAQTPPPTGSSRTDGGRSGGCRGATGKLGAPRTRKLNPIAAA